MRKTAVVLVLLLLHHKNFSQSDSLSEASDSINSIFSIPVLNTTSDDEQSQLEQQDVSPLLQSSRDVFTQFTSFQFGAARYRMRGYTARNQQIYMNGVILNSPETGSASWSSWGGLNDVTRFAEVRIGTTPNPYGFGAPGGYINIDSKASSFKKGSRFSYSNANKIYRNRLMLSYSTGQLKNNWSFSFAGSGRSGNEVYFPGTYFNAASLYCSADKKIKENHLLSITAFAAPNEQGRMSSATKEVFELAGGPPYNSRWGNQNGKVRNSNVSKVFRPTIIIHDQFYFNKTSKLSSSLYFNFGRSSNTGLNWNDAANPYPDYYRYLPSYYYSQGDTAAGDQLTQMWTSDKSLRQINWDKLISLNQANLYSDPHLLGQTINTTETRARYILEKRVENVKNLGFTTTFNTRIKKIFFSAGLNGNMYQNRKFKEIEDLLGSTFWIDVDQFAENLGVEESIQQNDLDNPNKKVKTGDRFGYDYSIKINRAEVWSQLEYSKNKFDTYVAFSLSGSSISREGYVANGKFPTSSKGLSDPAKFITPSAKAGVTYKINGRHFITANGSVARRPPETSNIFISPGVRNDLVRDIQPENYLSGDINYHLKYPGFNARLTYYNTQINNQTLLRTYWSDEFNNTVNLIMRNINQNYQGIEIGFERTFLSAHVIQGAMGYGKFVYTNRPLIEAWQDNNNTALYENRMSYLKNYNTGGSPQLVSGLGYKFSGKKFWSAGLYGNYFDRIFVEPNPDRRTLEATGKFRSDEINFAEEITAQEQLPAYFVLNANASKSFRLRSKYFINLNLSVNNLLNNKNIIVGGFESLRWDQSNVNKFPNKYSYLNGVSYLLTLTCSF